MKIASIQTCPLFKKKEENLRKLVRLVQVAVSEGAELIVMPELATTGYSFLSKEEAAPFAETIQPSSPTMMAMQALASRHGAHLVWGMMERDAGTGLLYNSQVYLDPTGFYETYRKINLWGQDYIWASEGQSNPPIVKSSLGKKIGLLICRDIRDKKDEEWNNFYSKGDADVICLSSNFGDGGFPAVSWMDFVKNNDTTLVVSNRYGHETNNNFGEGGICIIEPPGTVHCQGLRWNADCIVYAEVP
jgi:predicted amidohydrolase